ncbi:MAG TPA: hypothetical protein DEP25_04235 [Candidatus Taylorbacteria bacterium]|nr:hypothetical protein [Candidatus Taylorbacteria bacterium]
MHERKRKILYVITKGSWGGAQRYVFDLATSLSKNEFDVEVAVGEGSFLKERLTAHGIRVVSVPALQRDVSFVKEIHSFLFLYKIFRTFPRPDIVHLNSSKAGALGALAARIAGVPRTIFTAHGWPFKEEKNFLWRIFAWLASYITALFSTDIITVASLEFEQAKAMPFVAPKVRLIHNGIRPPHYLSREEAREKLGLPKEIPVIGSIGELTRNKNYAELISATRQLARERDCKLVIIGGGEDLAEMAENTQNDPVLRGRVILCGFKEDAYTYLKAYDIFALPSLKEGLPYVLLEAGGASLPVVASSVGGIPDIVENGKTGLIVPPKDSKLLEGALRELLEQEEMRKELGCALKERVEKTFSFEHMSAETMRVYLGKESKS